MKTSLQGLAYGFLLLVLLGCEPAETPPGQTEQAFFFIQALKQVERGGQRLQSPDLDLERKTEAGIEIGQRRLHRCLVEIRRL